MITNEQVASLCKAFVKNSSSSIKLLETELFKIIQSGRFVGKLLGSLIKIALLLMKNLLQSLAKTMLIQLGLITVASAADAGIHKMFLGPGIIK